MQRCALWLMQEVGVGNTFTKEHLRQSFPGVAQADRRMRDLRKFGWVIRTSADDATLLREDQRFVGAGVPVWEQSARRAAAPERRFSAKEKTSVLARDSHMCTQCGVAAGDSYLDDPNQTALLSVVQRSTVLPDGQTTNSLVTECKRCHSGSGGEPARADEVLASYEALDDRDRQRFRRWTEADRRGSTPLERVWSAYRRLPPAARDAVRGSL
ncbi:hypothetical protein GCM10010172_51600 [Paractinoplanes ferrugineus]